jgi:3',5'-cyclic AMP phosphodiesterase CpdA
MHVYFLADLHVGRPGSEAAEVLDRLHTIMRPGDGVAFLGDLTDNGSAVEYAALRKMLGWLVACGVPRVAVEGNHDTGCKGLLWMRSRERRWSSFARWFCGGSRTLDVGKVSVLGIDTTRHTLWPGDLATQEVGSGQLKTLDARIDEALYAGKRPVVAGHGGLLCDDPTLRLGDAERLWETVRGRAWSCIEGHWHKDMEQTRRGVLLRSIGAACDGADIYRLGA